MSVFDPPSSWFVRRDGLVHHPITLVGSFREVAMMCLELFQWGDRDYAAAAVLLQRKSGPGTEDGAQVVVWDVARWARTARFRQKDGPACSPQKR